jgi:hypothetical protein
MGPLTQLAKTFEHRPRDIRYDHRIVGRVLPSDPIDQFKESLSMDQRGLQDAAEKEQKKMEADFILNQFLYPEDEWDVPKPAYKNFSNHWKVHDSFTDPKLKPRSMQQVVKHHKNLEMAKRLSEHGLEDPNYVKLRAAHAMSRHGSDAKVKALFKPELQTFVDDDWVDFLPDSPLDDDYRRSQEYKQAESSLYSALGTIWQAVKFTGHVLWDPRGALGWSVRPKWDLVVRRFVDVYHFGIIPIWHNTAWLGGFLGLSHQIGEEEEPKRPLPQFSSFFSFFHRFKGHVTSFLGTIFKYFMATVINVGEILIIGGTEALAKLVKFILRTALLTTHGQIVVFGAFILWKWGGQIWDATESTYSVAKSFWNNRSH